MGIPIPGLWHQMNFPTEQMHIVRCFARSFRRSGKCASNEACPHCRHLVLQADNTPAQTKNGIVGAFAALLVSRHLFNTVTVNFLMVGHTHEDVDQAFAILVSQVIRRYR